RTGLRFIAGFGVGWLRQYSCPDCSVGRYPGAPSITLGGGFRSGLVIIGVEGRATFNEQREFVAAFVTAAGSPSRASPFYLRLGLGPSSEPGECVTVAEAVSRAIDSCGSQGVLAVQAALGFLARTGRVWLGPELSYYKSTRSLDEGGGYGMVGAGI